MSDTPETKTDARGGAAQRSDLGYSMIWASRLVTEGRNVDNDQPADGAQQLGRQSSLFGASFFGGCADEDGRSTNL
jgi:hypothetical protein